MVPLLNSAGRWIFENKSGGWWHPIPIHLEAHEIQSINGESPPFGSRFNSDVSVLQDNTEIVSFMKFRTFTGPFVFHCHNLEHEDIRMMRVFDPRDAGQESTNDSVRPHNFNDESVEVSGMIEADPQPMLFDDIGDVDILENRGVGFPNTDFEPGGQTTPESPFPPAQLDFDEDEF